MVRNAVSQCRVTSQRRRRCNQERPSQRAGQSIAAVKAGILFDGSLVIDARHCEDSMRAEFRGAHSQWIANHRFPFNRPLGVEDGKVTLLHLLRQPLQGYWQADPIKGVD